MPYFYNEQEKELIYLNSVSGEVKTFSEVGNESKKDEGGGNSSEEEVPEKKSKSVAKGKRTVTCSKCGKPGHQARTCDKQGDSEDPEEEEAEDTSEPITPSQFSSVKTSKDHGLSPEGVAGNMDVGVSEIQAAWEAKNYNHYLARRRAMK